ncbi:FAD/NAD-binding domain-containing protein [Fomitiporia mediterranea MF3/22]|uniref:FAD/NAD-binding domain-containing protein n=1 Tax=Fomitiporia mediterranea (strain MF3/22) TaxID=694068 RepID=UPI0004409B18|nr:FAD/NAD-binding domain-containing protein [Fomitiporia mediterranea MF3/22]EJD05820.1 FAD/NAD-binding domain-containing protein [Fomitiporia mediterranea MF3/22]
MGEKNARKAVVVGAGPVGCLAALSLAKMGWEVEVYEGRPDMRLPSSKASASLRSINLAISARGITAIQSIDPGAASHFLENVIPMKGRMIHGHSGKQQSQLYDRDGQCINSIDRGLLNEGLLEEVLARQTIRVFFQHKLTTADFDSRVLTFHESAGNKEVTVPFDFCVGADGSYSNVRRQLMRCVRMDFQQTYIPHEYLELKMPAGKDAEGNPTFLIDPNHLHIWPRHSFMLIALPNKDKSFTCTLFAPTAEFDRLSDPEQALTWFESYFPDALPLIGEPIILEAFQNNPRSPLIAIKANPYYYKDRAVIIGDAAHSMVPFFGQGLNCGLEDVRVLDVILRGEKVDPANAGSSSADAVDKRLARALKKYSETRHSDLVAISDLAMANYVEMRHSVATPSYLFLRALNNLFSLVTSKSQGIPSSVVPLLSRTPFPSLSPAGWIPLYTMVTFRPDISYSTAKQKAERQQKILTNLGWLTSAMGILGVGFAALKLGQHARSMH